MDARAPRRRTLHRHDRSQRPEQALRLPARGGRRLVPLRAGDHHRLPGPQRRRQVHHPADDLRAHPADRRHHDACSARATARSPTPAARSASCSTPPPSTPGRSGREVLRLTADVLGVDRRRVPELLDRVGLPKNAAKKRVGNYSLGMRQRLGIAQALMGEPQRADPRRARQRARPRGHLLDARAAARLRRPRRHRAAVLAPAARGRGGRRRARGDRRRQDRRPGRKAELLADHGHARPRASIPRRSTTACSPPASAPRRPPTARWWSRPSRRRSAGVAAELGVALIELRPADGGGLEQLFLSLTTREEVAA